MQSEKVLDIRSADFVHGSLACECVGCSKPCCSQSRGHDRIDLLRLSIRSAVLGGHVDVDQPATQSPKPQNSCNIGGRIIRTVFWGLLL